MRSMTGFGRASGELDGRRVSVTVQTVNHRNLDLVVRLPESLRGAEPAVRDRVARLIRRGRCEVSLVFSDDGAARRQRLDPVAVRAWLESARPLVDEGLVEPRVTLGDLLRGGAALDAGDAVALDPERITELLPTIDEAVAQAARAREFEGERLAAALAERRQALAVEVGRLEARREAAAARAVEALGARLRELAGEAGLSPERLAQETAVLADRLDVREELDRLRAHLEQLTEVEAEPGAIGRRLDFLVQELLRELNTLAAKCRDVEMIRHALDAKLLCEQMREQVQNVE